MSESKNIDSESKGPEIHLKKSYFDRIPEYKATLKLLMEQFPSTFSKKNIRPLKINIFQDLKKILSLVPNSPLSVIACKRALAYYTNNPKYHQAFLTPKAVRIDLQGKPVEKIDPKHIEHAKLKYEEWQKRFAKKRKKTKSS